MRRAAMLHLKAVMNMGPRFLGSVVALSLAVMSAPSIAADSVANVEWAAATVGFAKDGKAHGGICTDKKSESVAASCALKAFKDAGGITLSSSQAWNCKGYSAAAIVIPAQYSSLATPGAYVREVLDEISGSRSIGVFSYESLDTTSV